jgi:O-phosphoseryl-tRNA(Cys) synthetase
MPHKAINDAQTSVPECVAIGVVDVDSGLLLDVKTVDSHPSEVLDLVAAATGDLFQGPNVTAIENSFKKMRGVNTDVRYFQEIIVNSNNLIHVFLRMKQKKSQVVVFVCRNSANIGMVLSKARLALPSIEAAI